MPGALAKSTRRLTIAERDKVLEYMARGWPQTVTVRRLAEDFGITITTSTLYKAGGYKDVHAEEIQQRKALWYANLRGEPLTEPRNQVRELARLFGAQVRELCKEPCARCVGEGAVVAALGKPPQRCPACRGLRWMLPAPAKKVLDDLSGDVRLETLPGALPRVTDKAVERLAALLAQIREVTGDAWSPREKGGAGGDEGGRHLHLHGVEGAAALKEAAGMLVALLAAPADQVVAVYRARAGLPQGAVPDDGAGQEAPE